MSTFILEIITPDRIAFTDEVEMVTVPSANGILGILPNHVPLFTNLVQGEVKITKGSEETFLAIGDGFLEVSAKKVSILVSSAFHAHEINEREVMDAKKRAEEALLKKPTGSELTDAQALFRKSIIGLKVLRRKKARN